MIGLSAWYNPCISKRLRDNQLNNYSTASLQVVLFLELK